MHATLGGREFLLSHADNFRRFLNVQGAKFKSGHLCWEGDVGGEFEFPADDAAVGVKRGAAAARLPSRLPGHEGWAARKHLVDQHPQAPVVHRPGILNCQQNVL